ncbi:hypothetical protein AB3X91_16040 [Paraburkholderia sp. BR14263]|uniref:hypothetical protein n=1 Tax=unclassified Paraburkholderia TaxID=2615204 RepID=UPI0034D0001A
MDVDVRYETHTGSRRVIITGREQHDVEAMAQEIVDLAEPGADPSSLPTTRDQRTGEYRAVVWLRTGSST